jgi:hypothetical protein
MVEIAISMNVEKELNYNHSVTCKRIEMAKLGTGCIADSTCSGKRSSAGRAEQMRQICSMAAPDTLA